MRLIDADALKNALIECTPYAIDPVYRNTNSNIDMFTAMEILDEQPTIDAVPVVRGEWKQGYNHEFLGEDWDEIPYIDCSQCKHREWHYDTENTNVTPPNFCPNCGAKMDGGK